MSGATDRLDDFWWVKLPAAASVRSRAAAGVLMDGRYLSALPAAAWVPPVLVVAGVLIGGWHPLFRHEEVFTASLSVMALMLAVGEASSAWGAWLWLGFVLGDFFLYPHVGVADFSGHPVAQLVRARVPLLLPYVLLALAIVFLPLTGRRLARLPSGPRPAASATGAEAALQAVVQAGLLFMWAEAAPTLIRPVYTWPGGIPTVEVMHPLQAHAWFLPLVAAVTGGARVVVEARYAWRQAAARRQVALREALRTAAPRARRLPGWAAVALKTAFTTFLLAGVLEGWIDALLFAAVFAGMLLARMRLARQMGGWARLAGRVPLLARFAAGLVVNFFVTRWIVTAMWNGTSAFRPILISVALSLLVFLILLPDAGARLTRAAATPRERPA